MNVANIDNLGNVHTDTFWWHHNLGNVHERKFSEGWRDTRDLSPIKVIEVKDDSGKSSRVSAVYDAAPRKSFVAALKDIPEIWEMRYDDNPPPVYAGLVHDYRMGEGVPLPGPFAARRIRLDQKIYRYLELWRKNHKHRRRCQL